MLQKDAGRIANSADHIQTAPLGRSESALLQAQNRSVRNSSFQYIWASSWENLIFVYAKAKTQISFAVTAKLISAFVFAT